MHPTRKEYMRLRKSLLAQLIDRDGLSCHYCGVWLIPPGTPKDHTWYYSVYDKPRSYFRELQIDHVIPVSDGGGNELNNLELACDFCNAFRRNTSYIRFKMAAHRYREIPQDVYEQMFSGVQGKKFDVD